MRFGLYRGWIENLCTRLKTANMPLIAKLQGINCRVIDIGRALDKQVIQGSFIIGMTTTSAAEKWDIIQDIQPAVVVAEECAEVLESHLMASLSTRCQQLILIGDHKQLRPKTSNPMLAQENGLQISMFERLILNKLPYIQLKVQRRMCPEISENLRFIYKKLVDHDIVKSYLYNDIRGLSSNVFWIDHDYPEEGKKGEMKIYKNRHESSYLVFLCQYLLYQGYRSDEITILTMYRDQMFLIRRQIKSKHLDGIRVDTVDNFQGEENEIILLSLVRNNVKCKYGFTGNENRICVSLSRAKQGLYIIGNSQTICSFHLWRTIYQKMNSRQRVAKGLTLVCSNHPDETLRAETSKDFSKWSFGGCTLPCDATLSCGHACPNTCHTICVKHKEVRCLQLISYKRSCGHLGERKCHETKEIGQCREKVQFSRKGCNHLNEKLCFQKDSDTKCNSVCGLKRNCGHTCGNKCSDCNNGKLHKPCDVICEGYRICGHTYSKRCKENTIPCCKYDSNFLCVHGTHLDSYNPCKQRCVWCCKHFSCSMQCGEICDRPQCLKPCEKRLTCGHLCIGMCGDPCPPLCRICQRDCFIGFENSHRFVQLPKCGDLIRVDFMDKYMELESKTISKVCPVCGEFICIKNGNRYEGIINKICIAVEKERRKQEKNLQSHQNFEETANKIRGNISKYIRCVCNYDVNLACLRKLTCDSVQNVMDIERRVQKSIDSGYLLNLTKQFGEKDIKEFKRHLNKASEVLNTPGRFEKELHEQFKLALVRAFGKRDSLESLMEIKFDCITQIDDTEIPTEKVGEKRPDGYYHINVLTQLNENIGDSGKL